jgi:hypothetical protein
VSGRQQASRQGNTRRDPTVDALCRPCDTARRLGAVLDVDARPAAGWAFPGELATIGRRARHF